MYKYFFIFLFFNSFSYATPSPTQPGLSVANNIPQYLTTNLSTNRNVIISRVGTRYLFSSINNAYAEGVVTGYFNSLNVADNWMYFIGTHNVPQAPNWNGLPTFLGAFIDTGNSYSPSTFIPITDFGTVPLYFTYSQQVIYNNVNYLAITSPDIWGRSIFAQKNTVGLVAAQLISGASLVYNKYELLRNSASGASTTAVEASLQNLFISRYRLDPQQVSTLFAHDSGIVTMGTNGNIITPPQGCTISLRGTGGIECQIGNVVGLKLASSGVVAFIKDGSAPVSTVDLSSGSNSVYYPKSYFQTILNGSLNATILSTGSNNKAGPIIASYGLASATAQSTDISFNLFSSLEINTLVYSVLISERNSPGTVYEGVVGSKNITIPYAITQKGMSKAATVNVTINSANTDTQGRCLFKTTSASIAVPLSLAFSNPGSLSKTTVGGVNCSGLSPVDILNMPWVGGVDVTGMYSSSLWMDMVFNLTTPSVLLDTSGKDWYGDALGSGTITVNATWN